MVEKDKSYDFLNMEDKKEEPVEKTVEKKFGETPKKKFKVIGIRDKMLILVDEKGNGSESIIPYNYKNVKIGETIYL